MKILYTFFALSSFFWCNAQKEKTVTYINQYKEIAIQEMIRTGVPAAITLAQAVLESQSGESILVKKTNNHFGIKCKPEWTGAKVYHNDDAKGECFRGYISAEASYIDHSNFLKTRSHYAFLFELDPRDHVSWVYGLKKAGYATSPSYPERLLSVIYEHNLDQYNIIAMAKAKESSLIATQKIAKPETPQTIPPTPQLATIIDTVETELDTEIIISKASNTIPVPVKNVSTYPSGVFLNNELQVIYASAGSSMLALANQFKITLSKLFSFNDMLEIDILPTDQLIYLERKKKEGLTDFYIAKPNETIYQIAQITGVRMEYILQYNKFNLSTTLTTGSKIFLKESRKLSPTKNKK